MRRDREQIIGHSSAFDVTPEVRTAAWQVLDMRTASSGGQRTCAREKSERSLHTGVQALRAPDFWEQVQQAIGKVNSQCPTHP